jgi:hypothetical protein
MPGEKSLSDQVTDLKSAVDQPDFSTHSPGGAALHRNTSADDIFPK